MPRGPDVILSGDDLICYGSEEAAELFSAGEELHPGEPAPEVRQ